MRFARPAAHLALALAFALLACGGAATDGPQGLTVRVQPATATVGQGGSQAFEAQVTGTTSTGVVWSVQEGALAGSVGADGVFTAGAAAGTFHVVATSAVDPGSYGVATVTVTGPAQVAVAVSPASASVAPNATRTFSCTVTNAQNTACSWSILEGAAGGQITAAGVYTAPAAGGTYHVVAAAAADTSRTAAADVVVRAPAAPGSWGDVTPDNANLTSNLSCGNYGTQSVGVDPQQPSTLYAQFNCQGVWKSSDFGATWTGPINTGANGATAGDCAGGISVASGGAGKPAVLYQACIRGAGLGFWRSTDGGVSWTRYNVAPGGSRQDFYPPSVDPYDPNHLLMTGHEMNVVAQSTDGGQTWTNVPMAGGMNQNGGTAFAFFIDTGSASTTRSTFLWIGQQSGGAAGTWRTTNGGSSWTQVDRNEHPHGGSQIFQAGGGVVYMAGAYSSQGWGVLRSADYGQTWQHVGASTNEATVWGTPSRVYAAYGWANALGATDPTNFQSAAQPGTSWSSSSTPSAMREGPAAVAVTYDGTHHVFVGANWWSGLWRYVEP